MEHDHLKVADEYHIRTQKVRHAREQGKDVWPAARSVDATSRDVLDQYAQAPGKEYKVAGRVMVQRFHGKAAFALLQDRKGQIQIYVKEDNLGHELFEYFKHAIDIGDYLWVSGTSFVTKTGQITLDVKEFSLISKSLHPLPEKFHGLTDIETKYRQRYLDLISSDATRERFIKRSKIIKELRRFMDEHDFLEVETPMLHPIAGGAAARPFITRHNAYESDFYLRIAPELYLKRLVIGGLERVYEINRNFRNEGVSTRHNPEFTMCEMYMAHHDYRFIMGFVEKLLTTLALSVAGTLELSFKGEMVDFSLPFARMSIKEAVMKYCDLSEQDLKPGAIDAVLERFKVPAQIKGASPAKKMYALFEEVVEQKLIAPTFITDFPIEVSPLAKRDPYDPSIAARFELFIAGMEVANGFNELNDPFDQAERFRDQLKAFEAGDDEAHQYDADYITALEYGLPPTVGVGIGIDRVVMILTDTPSIKEVILFPTLKKK